MTTKINLLTAALLILSISTTNAQTWGAGQKILAADRTANDFYASSVAISGKYALVGAVLEDEDAQGGNTIRSAGSVYAYTLQADGTWLQTQKIVAADRSKQANFGNAIAMSGNHALIGAYRDGELAADGRTMVRKGAAYLFARNTEGHWGQVQKFMADDEERDDYYGGCVAVSGAHVMISAFTATLDANGKDALKDAGAVYVYEQNTAGKFALVEKLVGPGREEDQNFGINVAVSGNYALIGAIRHDATATCGSSWVVYAYERNHLGHWLPVQELSASEFQPVVSACAFAISGEYAVLTGGESVITGSDTMNYGAAYVYKRSSKGRWEPQEKITAADRPAEACFGNSVALDNDYLIVGDPCVSKDAGDNRDLRGAGAAYLFHRDEQEHWVQLQRVVASPRDSMERFGKGVDISGNQAIIAAPLSNKDLLGQNQLDAAGGAYLFGVGNRSGVSKISAPAFYTLFPNPTGDGNFMLDLGRVQTETQVVIQDARQQSVFYQRYYGVQQIPLHLKQAAGIYFVQIKDEEGKVVTLKLVRN